MQEKFEKIVKQAYDELPEEFRSKLDNVEVFTEDLPSVEQVTKFNLRRENKILLGLYEGTPQIKRGHYGIGGNLPDKVTLFRTPLLSLTRSQAHLAKLIKDTLYHEICHHFGMSEEAIRRAQNKSRN
ncbi:MAG: protein of unknown function DUF1025 [uncultured bacterium]|uniref:Metallopeptidase family protein n=1 Tax=Candidatus Woesebacteria bacterium RIFCSPHIGHO2_12_FULL_41_24 TaxID=1802510 RepID=A0A1F8AR23_9BACT|nr:MAG: protein of unknown function DUF1025 [uncultured bacterium]OGM13348.1 MAG: hypothetical protein A2W15_05605 [Candidatus Woesebacteria bacterium RBG_16_41_13]OGM30922.1 MAG: hypothetical protein A2873_03920 [Candidatus Woesebacteria bacterium RIFCSPHIGHO2_01_FULL_42_80]OGM35891.1 MAG: hypothetical protein A3D84_01390 [Candidatus Woesebacteria bacterium RIFCSPHIGHO2_02_FULL_42_20]OGM54216.1 MAG: hypothetical protein A3E44_00865 [Candidatus Woesebacteria bacterium RIFCSPHIGHO2_12_FULL_41_24